MPPNYGFLPSPPITSNSASVCLLSALWGPVIAQCLSHHLLPPHCPRHSLLSAENCCKSGCCSNDHSIKTEVLPLSTYQKLLLHINVQRQAITSATVVSSGESYHFLAVALFNIPSMETGLAVFLWRERNISTLPCCGTKLLNLT